MSTPNGTAAPLTIAALLRAGESVSDREFDSVFLPFHRRYSDRYWTPLRAARRAARWLLGGGARRILDVGAGVGKLCLIGGMTTTDARFHGIEQRAGLVAAARAAADLAGISDRVTFEVGSLESVIWHDFEAVYLFNSFGENLHDPADVLDDTVELSEARYRREVLEFEHVLLGLRVGTRVVTFHGFGGCFPSSYALVETAWVGGGRLNLWIKGR